MSKVYKIHIYKKYTFSIVGSSRGTGNFDFKLQTYSDSTYSTVASDGFKTGELMFFDIKLDRAVDGVQFTGAFFCSEPLLG